MANLVRLCAGLNSEVFKPLFNWKILIKLDRVPSAKLRANDNKWYHFTKRKFKSNAGDPLSKYIKIGVGVTAGISAKIIRDNSIYCLKRYGSRLTDHETHGKNPNFNWTNFFKLLQSYWLELLGAVLSAVICALLNIQIPRALGEIIDVVSELLVQKHNFMSEMKKPIINMITYYFCQSIFTFFYIALLANVGEGISKTMKVQMFSSIMKQDIKFFDSNRSGEILNRLTIDIHDFKSSFKLVISQGLRNITQIIGCTISLFFISPTMTGIMIIVVPTIILGGTLAGSILRQLSYKAKTQDAKVTLAAEEAISNIRTVRSFAMEEIEKNIIDEEAEISKRLNVKLGYGIALFQAGTNFFLNGLVLSTLYVGSYMMATGNISAGDVMAFLVAIQTLQRSFTQLSLLFGVYIKGKHAGARVFEMIDLPPGKTLEKGKIIPYHSLMPSVQFKNVAFTYPSRMGKPVLRNFNLYIPAGKTVAIVGSSGSGKSTLAWLLERFYDVQNGVVLIGGEDVRDLDATWLRKNVIGFISQEPILFATTILENIRYGKPTATDEEVIEAAKLANADKFIREFPMGYQTMVGERGVSVSGGQKQRIAIARALLKNPSILILDEATSALDSESENILQQSLENFRKSRTTVVIAHRLSTIKNADLIVVLNNGYIVEAGTHKELMAKNRIYASLFVGQSD